ncbi:MAG: hypothetical protein C4542_08555 [Dehalococcoidia bacterium]|nr:MAG: hypothetical protein C4542_08555 [Dehalococcoidia bacterium]
MSAQSLYYVIILGQGFIIALLGFNFITQGRNLLQPENRVKSASQMIYTGLALVGLGAVVGLLALILVVLKR